ncbi:hypothetical protein FAVG1_01391 [Fusarium avenaceum]|nr:hypothetical protein FAVG1_01391 [Fusarium avenaceum]
MKNEVFVANIKAMPYTYSADLPSSSSSALELACFVIGPEVAGDALTMSPFSAMQDLNQGSVCAKRPTMLCNDFVCFGVAPSSRSRHALGIASIAKSTSEQTTDLLCKIDQVEQVTKALKTALVQGLAHDPAASDAVPA